jgi:hypothetical protein
MRHGLFCGDLDDVEFIQAVEEQFGVGFEDTELHPCLTIGDFHAVLMGKLGDIEGAGGQCASQMAFYRLRKAAGPGNAKTRPETRLDELGLGNPKITMRALQRIGLKAPNASFGLLGSFMIPVALLAGVGFTISAFRGFATAAGWSAFALGLSVVVGIFAPRRYPEGIETLGDLAKTVALRNPMMLSAQGAGIRPGDIWLSVRDLAAEQCGIPAETIFPDTPHISQKVKSEAA